MSVLTAIRDKFTSRKQADRQEYESSYWKLVTALADGEEPDLEAIEAVLSEIRSLPTPVCPKSPGHKKIRKRGAGEDGLNRFLCDDCGTDFQQKADFPRPTADGRKTIDELQADVELLHNRRRWAEQMAAKPDVEKRRRQLTAKLDQANDAVQKAYDARKVLTDQLAPELQAAENQIRDAETAARQLTETVPYERLNARDKELTERRKKLQLRHQELKRDLYGAGQIGTFTQPERGSTGDRVLSFQRQIEQLNPADARQAAKRDKLKRNEAHFWQTTVEPKQEEMNRIASSLEPIDAELEEIRRQKLTP